LCSGLSTPAAARQHLAQEPDAVLGAAGRRVLAVVLAAERVVGGRCFTLFSLSPVSCSATTRHDCHDLRTYVCYDRLLAPLGLRWWLVYPFYFVPFRSASFRLSTPLSCSDRVLAIKKAAWQLSCSRLIKISNIVIFTLHRDHRSLCFRATLFQLVEAARSGGVRSDVHMRPDRSVAAVRRCAG
jgi:hypothetical protein